jgi:hypothetical protein
VHQNPTDPAQDDHQDAPTADPHHATTPANTPTQRRNETINRLNDKLISGALL